MELLEQKTNLTPQCFTGTEAISFIADKARICYQSEKKTSDEKMVRNLIARKHLGLLEHIICSVEVITDRQIGNEIERHRIGSYVQESTRFCRYKKGIRVIDMTEFYKEHESTQDYLTLCLEIEKVYSRMLERGETPQMAAKVLPLGLATQINMTYNLRQWRDVFEKRLLGTTGKPHPMIRVLMAQVLFYMLAEYWVFFEDIAQQFVDTVTEDVQLQNWRGRINSVYFLKGDNNA